MRIFFTCIITLILIFSLCACLGDEKIREIEFPQIVQESHDSVLFDFDIGDQKDMMGKELSTIETTESPTLQVHSSTSNPGKNDEALSDGIAINVGEYFAAGGKRLVDRTEPISKEEFLKKYPISLPEMFSTVAFYFEKPTEIGIKHNEVENGFVDCTDKNGNNKMQITVCDTKYVGLISVWQTNSEPKSSHIHSTDVIICKQNDGAYWGRFEKKGYYYTFKTSNMDQEKVISALNDLLDAGTTKTGSKMDSEPGKTGTAIGTSPQRSPYVKVKSLAEAVDYINNKSQAEQYKNMVRKMQKNGYILEPLYKGKSVFDGVSQLYLVSGSSQEGVGLSFSWKNDRIACGTRIYYLDEADREEAELSPYRYSFGKRNSNLDSLEKAMSFGWEKTNLILNQSSIIAYYMIPQQSEIDSTCCFVYDGYMVSIDLYKGNSKLDIIDVAKDLSFVKHPI